MLNFARVGYFRQLLFSSTLAAFLIVAVASELSATSALSEVQLAWKRAAFVGFWSTCTAAAGILGMARYQGVLSAVISSSRGGIPGMLMLISPPALFGSLAFMLAYLLGCVWSWRLLPLGGADLVYFVLIAAAAYTLTLVIATLFLVTRHATTYEILLLIPLLALSGIFTPASAPRFWQIFVMPPALPLYGWLNDVPPLDLGLVNALVYLAALVCWATAGFILSRYLLRLSLVKGSLEKR